MFDRSHPNFRTPFLTAVLVVGAMLPAAAQEASPPSTGKVADEPVVLAPFIVNTSGDVGYHASNSISATRINAPLHQLPVTITAFTQEFISDQKPRDLLEIVRFAPGVVSANPEFVGGQAIFSLRGFESKANLRNGFAGPAVLDAVNIARVEVVKGPSSMLYGNIEPGGVVNYITKAPMAKSAASFEQTVGTAGFYRTEADINAPLGKEGSPFLFRLVAAYDHAGEYFDPSERVAQSVSPSFTWNIAEKTQLNFNLEHFSVDETPYVTPMQAYNGGPNNYLLGPGTDFGLPWDLNFASTQSARYSTAQIWMLDGHTEIGGWMVRAAFNRFTQRIEQFNTETLAGTSATAPTVPRRGRIQFDARVDEAYSVEATRSFDFHAGSIDVLLGYQYNERVANGSTRNLPGAATAALGSWNLTNPATWNRNLNIDWTLVPSANGFIIENTDDAAFASVHLKLLDNRLHVLTGVRYANAAAHNFNTNTLGQKTIQPNPPLEATETVPQIGGLFEITKNVSVYASYAKSFRPEGGGLTVNGVANAAAKEPLVGGGIDLGIKFSSTDSRFTGTLAVFELDYKGTVSTRVVGVDPVTNNVITDQVQGGLDRSRGVEVDFLWQPNDNWQLYTTYGYLDSWRVAGNLENFAGVLTPVFGETRPGIVHNTANFLVKYSFTEGSLKGFSVSVGANYIGDRKANYQSNYHYPSYLYTSLLASYRWNRNHYRYHVDLSVKNVLDEQYYESTATTRGDPLRASVSFGVGF